MSNPDFSIMPERPDDLPFVEQLLDDAFGLERRTKTAYRLREGSEPEADLCFVARHGGRIVGTVRFWPLWIDNTWPALLLGPLAVALDFRGHRCGIALMRHGLGEAAAHGHERVILVGDEPCYRKVGFMRVPDGAILLPGPVDPDRLLYRELVNEAMAGVSGLAMSPVRSAPLAEPGDAEECEQGRQAEQR